MRFPCHQSGCSESVEKRGRYCERHQQNNDRTRDQVRKLYNSREWSGGVGIQPNVLMRNAQCQRLINGKRCWNGSTLVHHRISPRVRPDLFSAVFDENGISNLIALCRDCHPNTEGTPEWREGIDFVRTEFVLLGIDFAREGKSL
jgi:hypothetical protein